MYQNSYLYRMGTVCSTRTPIRAHTRIRIHTRHPKPVFMLKIGKKYFSIIRSKFNIKHRKFSFAALFAQFSHLFDKYNTF